MKTSNTKKKKLSREQREEYCIVRNETMGGSGLIDREMNEIEYIMNNPSMISPSLRSARYMMSTTDSHEKRPLLVLDISCNIEGHSLGILEVKLCLNHAYVYARVKRAGKDRNHSLIDKFSVHPHAYESYYDEGYNPDMNMESKGYALLCNDGVHHNWFRHFNKTGDLISFVNATCSLINSSKASHVDRLFRILKNNKVCSNCTERIVRTVAIRIGKLSYCRKCAWKCSICYTSYRNDEDTRKDHMYSGRGICQHCIENEYYKSIYPGFKPMNKEPIKEEKNARLKVK